MAHEVGHVTLSGLHCITLWRDSAGVCQGECIGPGIAEDVEVIDSIAGALSADYAFKCGARGKLHAILAGEDNKHDKQRLIKMIAEWTGSEDKLAAALARGIERGVMVGKMFRNPLDVRTMTFMLAPYVSDMVLGKSEPVTFTINLERGIEPQFDMTREQFCAAHRLPCIPLELYELQALG